MTKGTVVKADQLTISQSVTLLETHTASSSATIDLVSISSAYNLYRIEFQNIVPATNNTTLELLVGTGATPTYQTSSYRYATFASNQAGGTGASGSASGAYIALAGACINTATDGVSGTIILCDPLSTAFYKNMHYQYHNTSYLNNFSNCTGSAQWTNSSTPVTALRFLFSSGNIASGLFRLYGIT